MELRFIVIRLVSRVHLSELRPLEGHCPSLDSILCAPVRRASVAASTQLVAKLMGQLAGLRCPRLGARPGCRCSVPAAGHTKLQQLQFAEARLPVSAAPFAHSEAQACSSTKVGQTSDYLRRRSTSLATGSSAACP
jgi:hypothetical protein